MGYFKGDIEHWYVVRVLKNTRFVNGEYEDDVDIIHGPFVNRKSAELKKEETEKLGFEDLQVASASIPVEMWYE